MEQNQNHQNQVNSKEHITVLVIMTIVALLAAGLVRLITQYK